MTILTEGTRKAEFLVSEANAYRSRDTGTVTVPANTTLASGTILGQLSATDKFVRHNAGASPADGSESEAALLFEPLVNSTGSAVDFTATLIARDAEVNGSDLTYEAGADTTQIATSNAALAALGIIVR